MKCGIEQLVLLLMNLCRCRQRGLNRPVAARNPQPQGVITDADLSRPFRDRLGATLRGEQIVRVPIIGLFRRRRPITVLWSIVPVVITAVTLMRRTPLPSHVGVEIRRRRFPALTDRNATSSIPGKIFIARIHKTLFDLCPGTIFRRRVSPDLYPVGRKTGKTLFSSQTA